MPAPLPRWLRHLSRAGAVLKPCSDGSGRFAVYPAGDRRRRPLARLDTAQLREALARGLLSETDDGIELGADGQAALQREAGGQSGEGADFAAQHREMVDTQILSRGGQMHRVKTNRREGTLGPWAAQLDPLERAAGERFCVDHAQSSLHQHTTRNWSLTASGRAQGWRGGPEAATLAAIAAKDRVMNALAAVGAGMDQLLMAVCIRGEGIGAVERRFGWAQRSGKTVLKLALQQLARHYGMRI
ncbi:DUF6456 domain-containing protein [uncultured Maricaulis sp.]|uniref:DUF6456 domain-containing protein n=1 Tax=uncultured Maricaulis sp. TaxID=174710 RepID=UPI0030DD2254|tara:strand:+ start:103939 stop:104670 length:732 start_codon:yes stop_codon:yes gene_type:complete